MADKISKETRSRNMSHIKSKNTQPEMLVRKYLFSRGLRYRVNDKRLPGKPDLVFPKYKTVIFVNGCFWHQHDCKFGSTPKSNTDYWLPKLERNVSRDKKSYTELEKLGWKIIIVWECELKKEKREVTLETVYHRLTAG